MSQVRVNFLNWKPDFDDFPNDGLVKADNVTHSPDGYKAVHSANTSDSISSTTGESAFLEITPLGYESDNWVGIRYASDIDTVELGFWNGWSEYFATAPGAATAGAVTSFSSCELNNSIIATAKFNFATAFPTATTIAAGYISYGFQYGVNTSWTDLPNSASGIVCGVINRFAFIGNDNTGVPGNNTVRWSGIDDPTNWPVPNTDAARAVQSGEQVLNPKYGAVTGIAGNDFFGYIFQESAITKVVYVGGDIVFTFDTFEEDRGCGFPQRLVSVDDTTFFESKEGRHLLVDDQIADIGYGAIDREYQPTSSFYSLKKNTAIETVFFSNNLAFNYKTKQWTRLPDIEAKFSINSLTGLIGQWGNSGGLTFLYDSDGGTALTAVIETASQDINEGGRAVIRGVRPLHKGGEAQVKIGIQDDLTEAVQYTSNIDVNSRTGMADMRVEGRYMRVRVEFSDGFTTIYGADVDFMPQGRV